MKCRRCGGSLVTSYDRWAKPDGLKCVACGRPETEEIPKMEEKIKECKICGLPKPVSAFSLNRSTPDGIERFCKECSRIIAAKAREKRSKPEAVTKRRGRKRINPLIVQTVNALAKEKDGRAEAVKEILAILRTKPLRTRIAVEVIGQLETEIQSGTIES